ncbi:NUDIX hydrolase [Cellulomonas humilata]|uniref:NUDIX hydrolase n=2 Tax=Cellulomonas humilata TaxID=144055 RepID=A0A7Y6A0Q9_9CELL|nr:NUDIX hydrolase [Cellulomonas humilata]NUU16785.1 NUDIX hydrolase [Cellulomonas humilata]
MPGGTDAQRDVVELPGAVGIVALRDDGRVLLVRQYRHPVRRRLWEIPAGLLDSTSETPQDAGERELFEEGGLRASGWHTLVDTLTSPGMSDETIRILLARGLTSIDADEEYSRFDEEAEMERSWGDLDEAVRWCLDGTLENGLTIAGLLAARVARETRFADLRPSSTPWRARRAGSTTDDGQR